MDTTGDMSAVQKMLQSWNAAQCISDADRQSAWSEVTLELVSGSDVDIGPAIQSLSSFDTRSIVAPRQDGGTCSYTQVQSGDGCYALEERCGISQSELEEIQELPGPAAMAAFRTAELTLCLPTLQQNLEGSDTGQRST